MSTLATTNIKHPSSASNNIVLDASGNVNIDSNTLYVDATNNRVGIGTTTVSDKLHVAAGNITLSYADGSTGLRNKISWRTESPFFDEAAYIAVNRTGVSGAPADIVLATGGAGTATEKARLTSDGKLLVGTSSAVDLTANVEGVALNSNSAGAFVLGCIGASASGQTPVNINRKTNDGRLIQFHQDGTEEGTISVSGTTVSYNGAHLSRWSQLPSGQEREEILRGSVLSNIDEMCEWGEEDNEQLNRMKVSDVEGDKNVSGVFQSWDDDDDTYINDFYCAMTGDFIIRIGEGVTVERGDLLMSAGDGTAKPQDDDIIRSKTIAKVTSTNVSCTYEDGSYCVPCVLMAC